MLSQGKPHLQRCGAAAHEAWACVATPCCVNCGLDHPADSSRCRVLLAWTKQSRSHQLGRMAASADSVCFVQEVRDRPSISTDTVSQLPNEKQPSTTKTYAAAVSTYLAACDTRCCRVPAAKPPTPKPRKSRINQSLQNISRQGSSESNLVKASPTIPLAATAPTLSAPVPPRVSTLDFDFEALRSSIRSELLSELSIMIKDLVHGGHITRHIEHYQTIPGFE